jgi:CRISPR-associated protein Cpf1
MSKFFKDFTNKYSLSKTLRFELKPVGKTLEWIESKSFVEEDTLRAEDYKKIKKLIDEYHKYFIDLALSNSCLISLEKFLDLYNKKEKNEIETKDLHELQVNLRKQITDQFSKNNNDEIKLKYKNLFSKELIQMDLIDFVTDENIELVEKFKNFTTYFSGFHENRKNIYSSEEQSTAIAYRLIHENLPTFIDNIKVFEKIKNSSIDLTNLSTELKNILDTNLVDDFFEIDFFNNCLTQKGIDRYNTLLGGVSEEGKLKIQGLNEYINLFNQKAEKKNKIPKLKQLYKQILSDKESTSFRIEEFENDNEVLEAINDFYAIEIINADIFNALKDLFNNFSNYELGKIYLKSTTSLTDISQKIYGDWSIIDASLNEYYDKNYMPSKITKKADEIKEKWLKGLHSIATIQNAINHYDNEEIKKIDDENSIINYFANLQISEENLIERIEKNYKEFLVTFHNTNNKKLNNNKEAKSRIKDFLDNIKDLLHFIKPLLLTQKEIDKDLYFYNIFDELYKQIDLITPVYDKVRNYLTKKPYSTEKIKLNFQNSQLLAGWDQNKESDRLSIILRKDRMYYLGIMDKKHNKLFKDYQAINQGNINDNYEKMTYKLLPGPNKMLPKVFFSKSRIEEFSPSLELIDNYKKETHKKGDNFNIDDCYRLIDFFKKSINQHEDWKHFNFIFSDTNTYNDLSDFYREVASQGYKLSFQSINTSYIDNLVNEGKLYLFQIYNKDFSAYSKGNPNLHTIYWKMLFDEENLKDVVYKLNGEAEIFFRKKSLSIEETAIHNANQSIDNKSPINNKKQSIFEYDIIKNKRYTLDKFQFHVPITMNFKATGNERINNDVNEFLQNNPDVNIIGIDRGERHLIYLTLINQKGEILKQESLNSILGVNYQQKLDNVEKNREQERKNWQTIENIKELKSGYLSQVVHKIATMMIEYNAIIIMEDLNFGFKRGRIKVEKQVYQKFEKALIDKLNYLIFKKQDIHNVGGALKALQLSSKFDSFKKLGKQCGFIYYVMADYTSKICPVTGFVNLLYPKYESVEKSKNFFKNFDSISFDKKADYFQFNFDYKKFHNKAEDTKTKWTISSYGDRLVTFRNKKKNNQWDTELVEITPRLKQLFSDNKIDFTDGKNFLDLILSSDSKDFFKSLTFYLKLILQMRNSRTGTDEDYLISPVADEDGNFFDSRKLLDYLPKDADANGAYNIARKGLMVLEKINQAESINKIDLKITNKEWLKFAQK